MTADIHREISTTFNVISPDLLEFVVNCLQSTTMTKEEKALSKLTHHRLHTLSNWPVWDAACDKHLEAHYTDSAFLLPILQPQKSKSFFLNILQIHGTFAIKDDGTWKA